jgi:peptidoglycan/LPS O-acetylase OafA/YrhL
VTLRIPSLDGFRALSFLLVFLAHAGLEKWVPGGLGVTVFFFLSGYLITTLLRLEFQRDGSVSLKGFWLRRSLRILPPFYLVLLGTIAVSLLFDPPGTLQSDPLLAQFFHYTNFWLVWNGYEGQPAGTGVYWSLAVEEHFYLLFPFIYIGMQRLTLSARTQAFLLWGLCFAVLIWRMVLVHHFSVSTDRTYMASDTRVDSILFGCALAVWNNPVIDAGRWKHSFVKYLVFPISLAILVACLVYRNPEFRETWRYTLQGIALTGVFAAAIHSSDWWMFKVLNTRFLGWLGLLSYSLYLVHFSVIIGVQRLLPTFAVWAQGLLAFAISVGVAWLIYVFVERPCANFRKQLSNARVAV